MKRNIHHRSWILIFILIVLSQVMVLSAESQPNSATLEITGLKPGVEELDLFDQESGAYIKTASLQELSFPIQVIEDRNGMFLIEWEGRRYSVGSTFVYSTKKYKISANCDNRIHTKPVASTRGIGGEGCE